MRIEEIRTGLCARLRERREEIEQSALTRVRAIADPKETVDPEYMQGLRSAVRAAINYGIDALERSEDSAPPIPTVLLSQARLAARNRVPLDTVLRRYFAGYTLLGDFVIEEAERVGISSGSSLKRLLRLQAALFDRLIVSVTEEYGREGRGPGSRAERRANLVDRLLEGELADASGLEYEINGWHLGVIAAGPNARAVLEATAQSVAERLLVIPTAKHDVWAWFGSDNELDPKVLSLSLAEAFSGSVPVAIGEAAQGLVGWRLTHRQAAAALTIALRSAGAVTRYGDVALLASVLHDDLLVNSLRQIYLAPLERERDGGTIAKRTLRAYFDAQRNLSSAAAVLGVNRHTVASRLAAIEERLDRRISLHATDLEMTLRLDDLSQPVGFSASHPATLAER